MFQNEINLPNKISTRFNYENLLFEFFVVLEDPLDHQEDHDVRQTLEVRDLVDRVGLDDHTH